MADSLLLPILPLMLPKSQDLLVSRSLKLIDPRKLKARKERVARLRRLQSKRKAILLMGLTVMVFKLLMLPRSRQVWCFPR